MKKNLKKTEWWCRKKGTHPNAVVTGNFSSKSIRIFFQERKGEDIFRGNIIDKLLARTLATRILECLDDLRENK